MAFIFATCLLRWYGFLMSANPINVTFIVPKSYWCSGIVVNPDAAVNRIEGRPRIHSSIAIIHKPINIIKPVYRIGPEKLLS